MTISITMRICMVPCLEFCFVLYFTLLPFLILLNKLRSGECFKGITKNLPLFITTLLSYELNHHLKRRGELRSSPLGATVRYIFDRYAPEEQPVYRSRIQFEESGSGGATCYLELVSKMKCHRIIIIHHVTEY